jgi:hypothetical protein
MARMDHSHSHTCSLILLYSLFGHFLFFSGWSTAAVTFAAAFAAATVGFVLSTTGDNTQPIHILFPFLQKQLRSRCHYLLVHRTAATAAAAATATTTTTTAGVVAVFVKPGSFAVAPLYPPTQQIHDHFHGLKILKHRSENHSISLYAL